MSHYSERLRDPRWQKKRLEIMQRDGFRCVDCEKDDRPLHVHHCAYVGAPWNAPGDLLITVCEDCHEKRQEFENDARVALGFIFARMRNAPNDAELEEFCARMITLSQTPDAYPSMWDNNVVTDMAAQLWKYKHAAQKAVCQ